MARKLIDVNQSFFEGFRSRAKELGLGKTVEKVCIETNEFEKEIIKSAKKSKDIHTYWASFILIEHDDSVYLVILDAEEEIEIDSSSIDEIYNNSGLLTLVGSTVDLFKISDDRISMLYDELLHDESHELDKDNIRFIKYEHIKDNLRPLRTFLIRDDFENTENEFYKITSFFLSQFIKAKHPSRSKFYDAIKNLCDNGSKSIPYDCILNAVISIGWQHVFLELYRCIEYLYGIPESKKLQGKISKNITAAKLLESLREEISWRPIEKTALTNVLTCLMNTRLEEFAKPLDHSGEYTPGKVAETFYNLRNSVVHFRSGQERNKLDDDKWQAVCVQLCAVIIDVYVSYEAELTPDSFYDSYEACCS